MKISEFLKIVESRIPTDIQEAFDNSGIQIGPFSEDVKKPILTLDVNEAVVNEAIKIGSNIIISHHPFFFTPIKKIIPSEKKSELLIKCIQNNITLYATHTPMDIIDGGLNDYFCELLGLKDVKGLYNSKKDPIYKVQVFVPETHKDIIVDKMAELGGGWIGNYSDCTFSSKGTGTFKAYEGTNPFIGKIGEREYVEEVKIESVIPQAKLLNLIKGVEEAHPYEEVAMEAFILDMPERFFSIGRIGKTSEEITLEELLTNLKKITSEQNIKFSGHLSKKINSVALCTGSGGDLMKYLTEKDADVYITGDLDYHDFQYAEENAFSLVEISHFNSEKFFPKVFKKLFSDFELEFVEHTKSYCDIF